MKRSRFTIEEKVDILKQHLLEKKALSGICYENNIHPAMFYRWQTMNMLINGVQYKAVTFCLQMTEHRLIWRM
ncbi:MAG: transposase [Planctomycetota bacterium]